MMPVRREVEVFAPKAMRITPSLSSFGLELVGLVNPRLVIETWVRSYRRIFKVKGLEADAWYQGQRQVTSALLPHVRCAVRPSAPHTIHAWACGEKGTLHYVYVPSELRCHGLGRALVEAVSGERGTLTHHPPPHVSSCFRGFEFNPYALIASVAKVTPCASRE